MGSNTKSELPTYEREPERFRTAFKRATSVRVDKHAFSQLFTNLKHFFIATWLDWVTLMITGATAAGVYHLQTPSRNTANISQVWASEHAFTRLFPVISPDNMIYWASVSFPYVEPIIPSALAGVIATVIPIFVLLLAQLWYQSFDDAAFGILGLIYSLVTGTCFQVILKKTIGGLRPHFLAVCKPDMSILGTTPGVGFQNDMYTAEQLSTGDAHEIRNGLESFPSGHSNISLAGLGYLSLYLFTHLKIRNLSRRRTSHWRMLLVVAPLLLAVFIVSTLLLGYHHHCVP